MAYSIVAQLQLQAPNIRDINRIKSQIETTLGGVRVDINSRSLTALNASLKNTTTSAQKLSIALKNAGANTSSLNTATKSLTNIGTATQQVVKQNQQLSSSTRTTTKDVTQLGNAFDISRKKMLAYLGGGMLVRELAFALRSGVRESIRFQTELSKTGVIGEFTIKQTQQLGRAIRDVAIAAGASGEAIAEASKLLASAGFSMGQIAGTAKLLAKINIGASFDAGNLEEAANSIILLNSIFDMKSPIQYARALEQINNLANKFPAEASSIVEGLSITGSVARQAGLSFSELASVLTVVKSRTRESDTVVGTSLRNSIVRLNRYKSIDILRSMGIDPVTAEGTMRPMFDIFKELSEVVSATAEGDVVLSNKLEDLFGQRQVGRILPLLRNFNDAILAKNIALQNGESLDLAQARNLETLGGQLQSLKEKWLSFTDSIVQSQGLLTATKSINVLSNAIGNLLQLMVSIGPAFVGIGSLSLGAGIGKRYGVATTTDVVATKQRRDDAIQAYGQDRSPANLKAMRAADLQYDSSIKLVKAQAAVGRSTTAFGKAINGGRYAMLRLTESVRLNARLYATGYLALTSLVLSLQEQTPNISAAFNTVSVAMIGVATGMSGWAIALTTGLTAIISFTKALDQNRRRIEQQEIERIKKDTQTRERLVLPSDPQAEQKRQAIETQGLLETVNVIRRRYGEVGRQDVGFWEQQGRAITAMFSGNFKGVTYGGQIEQKNREFADSIRQDLESIIPDIQDTLSKRAEQLGTRERLQTDPLTRQLIQTLRLYDALNNTVGQTDKIFAELLGTVDQLIPQMRGGYGSQIARAGSIATKARNIRSSASAETRAQELGSLPLTDVERYFTQAIERTFNDLPSLLSQIEFRSDKWEDQLTRALVAGGFDTAIISSIESQIDDMGWDVFAESLTDTSELTARLMVDYQSQREAVQDLTEAVRYASTALKEKLVRAFESLEEYIDNRSKYIGQTQDFDTFRKLPTNPNLSNVLAQQEAFDLSGTTNVGELGTALRTYTEMLNSGTANLADIPKLEDAVLRTKMSLQKLADVSGRLASVEKRRAEIELQREGKFSATESIILDPQGVSKQLVALEMALKNGIMNIPQTMRELALQATRTFETVNIPRLGGTGRELRERMLTPVGDDLGLKISEDNRELIQLNRLSNNIQQEALRAQYQLMWYSMETARNTAVLAGGVPRFATGGVVPGKGNKDTVLSLLTPGEIVLSKDHQEDLRKYSIGGVVEPEKKKDDLSELLKLAGVKTPTTIDIPSSPPKKYNKEDILSVAGSREKPLVTRQKEFITETFRNTTNEFSPINLGGQEVGGSPLNGLPQSDNRKIFDQPLPGQSITDFMETLKPSYDPYKRFQKPEPGQYYPGRTPVRKGNQTFWYDSYEQYADGGEVKKPIKFPYTPPEPSREEWKRYDEKVKQQKEAIEERKRIMLDLSKGFGEPRYIPGKPLTKKSWLFHDSPQDRPTIISPPKFKEEYDFNVKMARGGSYWKAKEDRRSQYLAGKKSRRQNYLSEKYGSNISDYYNMLTDENLMGGPFSDREATRKARIWGFAHSHDNTLNYMLPEQNAKKAEKIAADYTTQIDREANAITPEEMGQRSRDAQNERIARLINSKHLGPNMLGQLKFASGGMVPGSGSGDKVPALLEPGEFVLNKNAVQSIGLQKVDSVNKKYNRKGFQTGGSVTPQSSSTIPIDTEAILQASKIINQASQDLRGVFEQFNGLSLQHKFSGDINVTFTGLTVLQSLLPEIQKIAVGECKKVLSNFADKKLNMSVID